MTEDRIEASAAKEAVRHTLKAWEDRLIALSHEIHADPELAFAEHRAAARVADVLRVAGFRTAVGAYGLSTAVEAVMGDGEFTVTLCAEYDALPGIGHACGHNIIAAAGVGAAVALAPLTDLLGIRLKLLGTPAEEHGSGKSIMLGAGAWEDSTVSLMVHGAPGVDISCADIRSQAVDRFDVTFTGRAAHAAGAPELGVNAGNAATIALVALGLLRQHLPDGIRFNAFVAEAGEATNVIAASALVRVEVRSNDLDRLREGKLRVLACFEAGALATGCQWSWRDAEPLYANVVQDPNLAAAWDRNVAAAGRTVARREGARAGSTDMGNVSQVVPAIHPMIGVLGVSGMPHTDQFRLDAATPAADQAALDGALALAGTVIDIVTDPALRPGFLARQRSRGPGATMRPLIDIGSRPEGR